MKTVLVVGALGVWGAQPLMRFPLILRSAP